MRHSFDFLFFLLGFSSVNSITPFFWILSNFSVCTEAGVEILLAHPFWDVLLVRLELNPLCSKSFRNLKKYKKILLKIDWKLQNCCYFLRQNVTSESQMLIFSVKLQIIRLGITTTIYIDWYDENCPICLIVIYL